MGNWNINIQGVGCHHNANNPTDADKMTAEFLSKLRDAGHSIEEASFTYGSRDYAATPITGPLPPPTQQVIDCGTTATNQPT